MKGVAKSFRLASSADMLRRIVATLFAACLVQFVSYRSAAFSVEQDSKKGQKSDIEKFLDKVKPGGKPKPSSGGKPNKTETSASAVKPDPPRPTTGKLVVVTGTDDADVVIRSKESIIHRGRAQKGRFEADLDPGQYSVEATSTGRSPYSATVKVRAGETETLKAEFSQLGSIAIDLGEFEADENISADDLKILLDERPVEIKKTEDGFIELWDVPKGSHTLRFIHPSIKEQRAEVEVAPGARIQINPVLEVFYVKLTIKSVPGASIFIDGRHQGKIGPGGRSEILNLVAGRHRVRIEKQGYAPSERVVEILNDQFEVEFILNRLNTRSSNL